MYTVASLSCSLVQWLDWGLVLPRESYQCLAPDIIENPFFKSCVMEREKRFSKTNSSTTTRLHDYE